MRKKNVARHLRVHDHGIVLQHVFINKGEGEKTPGTRRRSVAVDATRNGGRYVDARDALSSLACLSFEAPPFIVHT